MVADAVRVHWERTAVARQQFERVVWVEDEPAALVTRVDGEDAQAGEAVAHVEVLDGPVSPTPRPVAPLHHQPGGGGAQHVAGAAAVVAGAEQVHRAAADVVRRRRVESGQQRSQVLDDHVRVVVRLQVPVGGGAVCGDAQPQRRHRLRRQVGASLGHVQRRRAVDVARLARVEEQRDVAARRPRLAHRRAFGRPVAGHREHHAEQSGATDARARRGGGDGRWPGRVDVLGGGGSSPAGAL